jgi:hypothetical protein
VSSGSVVVVTVSGSDVGCTVIDSLAVATCGGLSASEACTVKLAAPTALAAGVPVSCPVLALRCTPVGSVPEEIFQLSCPWPPVAWNWAL